MNEQGAPRIAVVGMAGRFPGAPGIDEFWALLRDGIEPSVELADAELLAAGVEPALLRDPAYVKRAAVLDGIERFDARFFGYTPREASMMDPQHRLFLETAWHALEHAGHGAEEDAGPVGVFAGASLDTYALNNLYPDRDFVGSMEDLQALMSVDKDFLATRVAYHRNLTGPAVVVQSTCSTSLLAVCQACQSLLQYGCDLAVAGGVSVRVPERRGYLHQPGGILSPDGRCRPFDAHAAGTYFSNGVGAVVLRRLEDALADGDEIWAVIRGWAVNNDGASKVGYTAPSVDGQAAVITMAQELAGVDPATIGCIEAHGTATALGDPIEVAALTRAFHRRGDLRGRCALGSVKSNFGHLDAAAGVAGFIKTVLALKHGRIPPSLHFERPNPTIDFAAGPFFVNAKLWEWPVLGAPRRAGVSSFGIGGTNAHVILEEAPATEPLPAKRPFELLVLSAKTESALAAQAANLAGRLEAAPDLALADVAHTLQTGRRGFARRRALVCRDAREAERALRAGRGVAPVAEAAERPGVAFLFPGQGAQYAGMARGLRDAEPEFRRHVDECAAVLEPLLGLDIREAMLEGLRITDTELAQPALFTVEYALARTWMKWGVRPAAMIGHSVGEYVAACLAGVLTANDALALIAARGKLMQRLPRGAMLAVPLSAQAASKLLDGGLALAASNAPELCVVSGPIPAVEALEARLREEGIAGRRLHTSHAFHSAMMDPVLEDFAREVRRVQLHAPRIPYVSNVTGRWIRSEEATDPAYWATHLRQTVRFSEGVAELLHGPVHLLLEVGPGRVLGALAGHHGGAAVPAIPSMRDARDSRSDVECLLEAAGRLWEAGVEIDWRAVRGAEQRRRVVLPGYPFERERHWVEPRRGAVRRAPARTADAAGRFWIPSWRRASPLPAPATVAERWLVLGGADQLTRRLTGALAARGREVITGEGRAPNVLWTRSAPGEGGAAGSEDEELELAFFGPVLFARALAASGRRARLVVLTRGAQDVLGTEDLVPERAAAAAACRVISQELAGIEARCIDLADDGDDSPERIEAVALDVLSGSTDPLVAHRGGYRWLPALEPVRLESRDEAAADSPDGAWIVTGGLGGLGLEIAEHLARTQRAKMVLLSRGEPDAVRLRRLAEIESLGGEVEIVRGDVSRADDVAGMFARARARFGAAHGVIHAAGVAGGHALEETTRETAAPVLLPKIAGAKLLAAACQREGCKRLVLFSSLASRVGGVGQGDYAAANAVLEAIGASAARRSSCAVTVVGWDAWSDVGMGTVVSRFSSPAGRSERLRTALTPAEGVDAFARILGTGHRHVLVSARDLVAGIEEAAVPTLDESPRPTGAPPPAASAAAQLSARELLVVEVWCELLGVDRLGPQDDFFALGGHSLLATQMLNRLRRKLPGVDLKLEDVFRAPTVERLAARIESAEAAAAAAPGPSASRARSRGPAGEDAAISGVALVLCTPRSGSTLFRLMLSAHPRLFCPPELWLLGHATLSEWSRDPFSVVYRDGLVHAFADLDGGRDAAAQELVDDLVRRGTPVADVYRMLRERSGGRLLVDKTPGYVLERATLARAERLFHEPRYVHLVRHPLACIESFARSRFDRFLEERGDPREVAERTWADGNGNALEFRAALPPGRHLLIRYEELVRTPQMVMQGVCAFLGVPYAADVVRPYERGRMFEGPGDPGFRAHRDIDPSRADAWSAASARALGTRARALAATFGYELPA
jgi:acyl transferase domain-containing protein/NAD(P)-dependent dehydrogenase (short-subunit alcohol dehydrogenase family)